MIIIIKTHKVYFLNILPLDKYSLSFPNPSFASDVGLIAYGGDLSVNRILYAYHRGIFPWYNEDDPILWWSPNPRLILEIDEFKVSKSLQKTIKKEIFEIRFDTNFKEVMRECSTINRGHNDGTWIHKELIDAYCKLHERGDAHSFEAYYNNELVGGGYGITVGNIFCGESMFAKKNDASKVAFCYLIQRLKENGFSVVDCKIPSAHLVSLGAKEISRDRFLKLVSIALENYKNF